MRLFFTVRKYKLLSFFCYIGQFNQDTVKVKRKPGDSPEPSAFKTSFFFLRFCLKFSSKVSIFSPPNGNKCTLLPARGLYPLVAKLRSAREGHFWWFDTVESDPESSYAAGKEQLTDHDGRTSIFHGQ